MTKFHLMHCVPEPVQPGLRGQLHGFHGHMEVIESLRWGLKHLGHQVTYARNKASQDTVNIILGVQALPKIFLQKLPKPAIVYNLEQLRGWREDSFTEELYFIAENFTVWDYSTANMETWKRLGARDVRLVPIGYAPILTRIPKPDVQDIDILIYGFPGEQRLKAFHDLAHAGFTVVFACGVYGETRDGLVARSKLVLNVNLYERSKIFEVVRVSYLLANRKAVVSIVDPATEIDQDIRASIKVSTMGSVVEDCLRLLTNDGERAALEEAGHATFRRRDILEILRAAAAKG